MFDAAVSLGSLPWQVLTSPNWAFAGRLLQQDGGLSAVPAGHSHLDSEFSHDFAPAHRGEAFVNHIADAVRNESD